MSNAKREIKHDVETWLRCKTSLREAQKQNALRAYRLRADTRKQIGEMLLAERTSRKAVGTIPELAARLGVSKQQVDKQLQRLRTQAHNAQLPIKGHF